MLTVLVSPSAEPCGVEAFARLLAEAVDRLAGRAGAPARTRPLPRTPRDLLALARELGPADTLVLNLPVVAWKRALLMPALALLAAWWRGADRLVVLHEWADLDPRRRALCRLYAILATGLLFSSPMVRADLEADPVARLCGRRILGCLPVPPNLSRPAATRPTPLARRMAAWRAEGRLVLASFGSIYPRKGPGHLVDIAAALGARGVSPVLVLVGGIVRGRDTVEADLLAQARARGVELVVSGFVDDPAEVFGLLEAADALVYRFAEGLTSRRGSVLACLQAGPPVVVNAPLDGAEFDHHPAYRALLAAGRLRLVPREAGPGAYADAVLASVQAPAQSDDGTLYDTAWDAAARALVASLRVRAEPVAATLSGRAA